MTIEDIIALRWKDRNSKSKGGNKSFVFEAPGFDYHIMTVFFGIPEEDGFFDQIMINCVPQNTTVNEWENSETHFYGQVKTRSELEMIMMFLGIIEYSLPPAEGAETIKQALCDDIEKSLNGVHLNKIFDSEQNGLPLVDYLSAGSPVNTIGAGKKEIENIVEQIYFDMEDWQSLAALQPQPTADGVEQLKRELIAYDTWLQTHKWRTSEMSTPEQAVKLYLKYKSENEQNINNDR